MKFKPAKKQFMFGELTGPEKAAFAILPVPYERTVSYGKGTSRGPAAILDASWQLELWDEETKQETWRRGIFTAAPVDCSLPEAKFFPHLERTVEELLKATPAIPFFLGGEHSITQALLPPFIRRHKDLSILHFDAHADLRTEYHGSRHSHACAVYPASRTNKVVQVGIRSVGHDERQFHNAGNVITHLMHENRDLAKLERQVLRELTDTVYLTIDVDGFDPSVMPGTGTPQPGGFGWYEALKLFRAVCRSRRVVGVDIVETAPVKGSNISELAAAKLAYRLMGYLAWISAMTLNALSLLGLAASFCALFWLFLRGALLAAGPAGLAMQALALCFMVWARLTLGRRSFKAAAAPSDGGLVIAGPYKYLRHPIYAAALYLTWAGVLTHPGLFNFVLGLIPAVGLGARMLAEEKLVGEKYPAYAAYAARTARVIPFLF